MTDYKKDFPLLKDSQVAYLDNAATAQRPLAVLEAEKAFYEKYNANPLRGLYELGMEATDRSRKQGIPCGISFMPQNPVRLFLHETQRRASIWWHTATD